MRQQKLRLGRLQKPGRSWRQLQPATNSDMVTQTKHHGVINNNKGSFKARRVDSAAKPGARYIGAAGGSAQRARTP
jgi:hypothetical protein